MDSIEVMKAGAPSVERVLALAGASLADDVFTKDRRVLRVFADAAGIHYKWSADALLDGEFLDHATWVSTYDADGRPTAPAEGAVLRQEGFWHEFGTSGEVTLNKTSPLYNLQDLQLSLTDADTRLVSKMGIRRLPAVAHTLYFTHLESVGAETLDYAIVKDTGAALHWLQGGGTFTASENWFTETHSASLAQGSQAFTPDEKAYYGVRFRPSSAQTGVAQLSRVYIAEDALATDSELQNGRPEWIAANGAGRLVVYGAAGNVHIAEMR